MKYLVLVCLVSGVLCGNDCEDDEEYYRRLDQITQEAECSRAGGACTFGADCPLLTGTSGQCPNQQKLGVECCYGVSVRDTRCRKNGGECFASTYYCRNQYAKASDCGSGEKCCMLF